MTTRPAVPDHHVRCPWAEVWLCLLFLFQVAHAEPTRINGRVVSVADGDTLTILDPANNVQHKIRLAGIDAPEKRQPFGQRSRQHLGHLAHRKDATALCSKIDRYRRRVCKVMVQPPDCPTCDKTLDIGLAQVAVGGAWWYREYAKEQSSGDRQQYESAEQEARGKRLGLWVEKKPVPPWEWRKAKADDKWKSSVKRKYII